MLIKVYGGTQIQDGESLCDTCVHSRITRGRRLEEELVMCTALMMHACADQYHSHSDDPVSV